MKNKLVTYILLLFSIPCFAQSVYPPISWLSEIKTTESYGANIMDIAVEPVLGNVYIAGRCEYPCTFSNGMTITPNIFDEYSFFLAKYDSQGALLWVKNLGSYGLISYPFHISLAKPDGVFITTTFKKQQVNLGNGVTINSSCATNCWEMFVAKFNADGEAQWAKSIIGSVNSYFNAHDIVENGAGTLILTASYEDSLVNFGPNFLYTNIPQNSFFIAEYNAATGQIINAHFPSKDSGRSVLSQLAINSSGQMVIVGGFNGNLKFENGLNITSGNINGSKFVASLDANGNAQWVRGIRSSIWNDILGLDIDEDGNAYLGIGAKSDLILDNTPILNINSDYASFVIKIDSSSFSVPVFIEHNNNEPYVVMDVHLDKTGTIYTSGFSSESLSIGTEDVTVDGCRDALLTATSSEGDLLWARTVGGTGCEFFGNYGYASNFDLDQNGYLYATGSYYNGFSEDGISLANAGALVAKFNTSSVETEEPSSMGDLKISPNPSTGNFSIAFQERSSGIAQLTVYDLGGRKVYSQAITEFQTFINASLPVGAYLVTVQNSVRIERQKLIIQH